ncbi:MAG TPA: hypothetical protein VMW08_01025 [Acidimicrobiales bacterium]|nr:hypothetical protein [Acidimicrobiales bacterium]
MAEHHHITRTGIVGEVTLPTEGFDAFADAPGETEVLIRDAYRATEQLPHDPRLTEARKHLDAALALVAEVEHTNP